MTQIVAILCELSCFFSTKFEHKIQQKPIQGKKLFKNVCIIKCQILEHYVQTTVHTTMYMYLYMNEIHVKCILYLVVLKYVHVYQAKKMLGGYKKSKKIYTKVQLS